MSEVNSEQPVIRIIEVILALALVASLLMAGARVYRHMSSGEDATTASETAEVHSQVTIVFRNPTDGIQVDLYPIDYRSAENAFSLSGPLGKTFDEFLAQRLRNLEPVRVPVDANGRGVVQLAEGNWWLRATSTYTSGEAMEWRLPLTISAQPSTIELSADNAYERTKKF